jgi:tetratricopeptide (TPR) repeat protein
MKNAESTTARLEKDVKEFLKAKKTKRNLYYLSQTYANLNDFENAYKYAIESLETSEEPNKPSYVDERATRARAAFYAIQLKMDFRVIQKLCETVINSSVPNIEAFIYLFRASIIYNCPNNVIKYVESLMNLRKPNDGQIINHAFYDYQRWTVISIVCLISGQKLRIGKQACEKALKAFPNPEPDDVQNMKIYNQIKI